MTIEKRVVAVGAVASALLAVGALYFGAKAIVMEKFDNRVMLVATAAAQAETEQAVDEAEDRISAQIEEKTKPIESDVGLLVCTTVYEKPVEVCLCEQQAKSMGLQGVDCEHDDVQAVIEEATNGGSP